MKNFEINELNEKAKNELKKKIKMKWWIPVGFPL